MEDAEKADGSPGIEGIEGLEKRVAELESLGESLGRAPDGELSGLLERAIELLEEVNAAVESRISEASQESGEAEGLLDRVDFGAFDAALGSLEHENPGGAGPGKGEG
ncbi:hypothetical protein [Rubrobacter aplysinae]|uniref:hypothetical protein n=1 Tax=Rubrobacter aplysinae TaxID=909625 RepID=UPI00064C4039|nr:hypothetical protein [Rubrobacter aplysinae]